ncbi:MAG: hypothetical protein IJ877_02485, partial [Candidatus Gastranaerophilales bacterium]|nr:hypothetical protein [Candidatus Gastranaerophilales bacterium]
ISTSTGGSWGWKYSQATHPTYGTFSISTSTGGSWGWKYSQVTHSGNAPAEVSYFLPAILTPIIGGHHDTTKN